MLKKAVKEWVEYLSPCLDADVIKAPGLAKGKLGHEVEKIKEEREEQKKARKQEDFLWRRKRGPCREEEKEIEDMECDEILPPTETAPLDLGDVKTSYEEEVDDLSDEEPIEGPSFEELDKDGKLVQKPDDPSTEDNAAKTEKLLKEALAKTKITGDHDKIIRAVLCFTEKTCSLNEIKKIFDLDPKKFYRIMRALKKSPKLAKDPIFTKIIENQRTITKSKDTKPVIKNKPLTCPKCKEIYIPGTYNEEDPCCKKKGCGFDTKLIVYKKN